MGRRVLSRAGTDMEALPRHYLVNWTKGTGCRSQAGRMREAQAVPNTPWAVFPITHSLSSLLWNAGCSRTPPRAFR